MIKNIQISIEQPKVILKYFRAFIKTVSRHTSIQKFVIPVFCIVILALSLRGLPGNPTSTALNSKTWMDNGPFELSPERGRYALTYSLIENKSVFFSVPVARFAIPDLGYKNGRYVSLFAPAVSFLIIPGYVIGKLFGASQLGAFFVISLFAVANVFLIQQIAIYLGFKRSASYLAAMTFIFATPAFNYGVTLYQHHISTFLVLLGLYVLIRYRTAASHIVFWLLFASSVPVDYPNLFIMMPLAVYAASHMVIYLSTQKIHMVRIRIPFVAAAIGMLLPLLFFFWFNAKSYGNPLQFSGTVTSVGNIDKSGNPVRIQTATITHETSVTKLAERKRSAVAFFNSRLLVNGLYILLLSPDRGLITFAPIMLIGLFGAGILYKKHKQVGLVVISTMAVTVLFYAMWGDVWGGWAFGSRYLVPLYAMGSICIAAALDRWANKYVWLAIFLAVFSYSVGINAAGALTSSANPPQVEVLNLEKVSGVQQRFSFDRNLDELRQGLSKSFVYRTFFRPRISAYQYYQTIVVSIILVALCILIGLTKRRNKNI